MNILESIIEYDSLSCIYVYNNAQYNIQVM